SLLEFWPTLRWNPGAAFRPYFVGSAWGQDFVGSRHHVVIELSDLLIVKKLVPCLHRAIGASISNHIRKKLKRQFLVGINQIRREVPANCIHAVASIAVNMPPLPSVIYVLISLRRILRVCVLHKNGDSCSKQE